jgi:hypothetical protein
VWQHVFRDFADARNEITARSAGTTPSARIKRLDTGVPWNGGLNNSRRWLDVEGALHTEHRGRRRQNMAAPRLILAESSRLGGNS